MNVAVSLFFWLGGASVKVATAAWLKRELPEDEVLPRLF